jgi:hypothetical protein
VDPDPQDPYVFGPPGSGSGSISTRYESGSGSLIPNDLRLLYDFLSLKNYVNVASKSKKAKNLEKKIIFVDVLKVTDPNPDPNTSVRGMDPQSRIRTKISNNF